MIYRFRTGHSAPVPAQVVGETLAEMEADDNLNPSAVVEASRPDEAPLHPAFEWDDERAAELYRENQARSLIRSVCVVEEAAPDEEDDEEPRLAFVSVGDPRGGARYVTTVRAMGDEDMKAQVLADALAALRGLRSRYGHLRELAEVFAALDLVEVPA